jgi:hypothetical protein
MWATLHGLAVLRRGGRIPAEGYEGRLDLLVGQIVSDARSGAHGGREDSV